MTASDKRNVLDKWLLMRELMSDPKLSRAALKLAFWLLDHLNGRTGRCDPGHGTLMREAAMDRSSIKRGQRELVGRGIFKVRLGGGSHKKTNHYEPDWNWHPPQGSNTPPTRATADPPTGGTDGPPPGSSTVPKTVKQTVNIKPVNKLQRENQANVKGAASVPAQPGDVDWDGWVQWLYGSHGIDVEGAWTYVMEAVNHLTEAGLSLADAYTKLDILFRVARKQRKPQPLGFIEEEIRKFVIRRDGAPSRSNY